jgi:hypothetical protein
MGNPKPGSKEWQDALNEKIRKHDEKQQDSGNDNQTFEISQEKK